MTTVADPSAQATVNRIVIDCTRFFGLQLDQPDRQGWFTVNGGRFACRCTLSQLSFEEPWYIGVVIIEIALDLARTLVVRDSVQAKAEQPVQAAENAAVLAIESFVSTAWSAVDPTTQMAWIHRTSMAIAQQGVITEWSLTQGDVFVGAGQDAFEDSLQACRPIELLFQELTDAVATGTLDPSKGFNWVSLQATRHGNGVLEGRALINNEPWPEALDALVARIPWPDAPGAFTCRQFTMLQVRSSDPIASQRGWRDRFRRAFGIHGRQEAG